MERCHNCGQELIEIDNRGQRLTGCITCNLWTAGEAKGWTRLSVEDLRTLHLLRHGGLVCGAKTHRTKERGRPKPREEASGLHDKTRTPHPVTFVPAHVAYAHMAQW